MLSRLQPEDVISTRMEPSDRDKGCSRELVVHRAVYQATDALAICHAHPPHTMFRSLVEERIYPLDSEARFVIGESVPVLVPEVKIGSAEAAEMLADVLRSVPSRCCGRTARSRWVRRCGTRGASSACSRSRATSSTCETARGCPCSEVVRGSWRKRVERCPSASMVRESRGGRIAPAHSAAHDLRRSQAMSWGLENRTVPHPEACRRAHRHARRRPRLLPRPDHAVSRVLQLDHAHRSPLRRHAHAHPRRAAKRHPQQRGHARSCCACRVATACSRRTSPTRRSSRASRSASA